MGFVGGLDLPRTSGARMVSTRRTSLSNGARLPESWTQLLGVAAQILEQAPALLLSTDGLVGGAADLVHQLWSDVSEAIIESPPSVLYGRQRELEPPREFDIGVAENCLTQHPLLRARETETRRRVDENGGGDVP